MRLSKRTKFCDSCTLSLLLLDAGAQLGNFERGRRYICNMKDEIIQGLSQSMKYRWGRVPTKLRPCLSTFYISFFYLPLILSSHFLPGSTLLEVDVVLQPELVVQLLRLLTQQTQSYLYAKPWSLVAVLSLSNHNKCCFLSGINTGREGNKKARNQDDGKIKCKK